jgi:hypothetical protein
MKMQRVISLCVFWFVVAPAVLAATPTVNSSTIAGNQLTITGTGFSGTPLKVTFNGQSTSIVSSSSTQIVATVNPVPAYGSYRLVVKAGSSSTTAYVTVPAAAAIVAQVSVTGQTAAIPTTTLFTPASNGLYRISSYGVVTVPNGTFGQWDVQLNWTDDSGSELCSNYQPCQLMEMWSDPVETHFGGAMGNQGSFVPNTTTVVQVKAGVPVTYSVVADSNGNPTGSTYELYITVEQLM